MQSSPSHYFAADRASDTLEVWMLGLVDFDAALFLQERLVYDISGREDTQGGLLLCEHPPMVTIGREGSRAHITADPRELTARQMPVRWVNRGGGCLVHAPGQLAIYPVLPLNRLRLGLADYRTCLEESVGDICRELHVPSWRREHAPGTWCRLGQVAHVGVAVKSWTSYHGLYVNVAPAMELMRLVDASRCGEPVTSLSAQRGRAIGMHSVREGLVRHLARRLGYERYHLYTGHPLLRRTTQRLCVDA